MEEFEEESTDEMFPFSINYDKIAADKEMQAITRLLAVDLMTKSYITVGEFYKNINDTDLFNIIECEDTDPFMAEILLMSQMLAKAEGVDTETFEQLHDQVQSFISFGVLTSLDRKDMIICHYDKMSLGEDSKFNVVAERKKDE